MKIIIIPFTLFIFLTINLFSFYCGLYVGLSETKITNANFIQAERDLKESLTSQLLYIEALHAAHEAVIEIERPEK